MTADDDPEARIRELERPLSDFAKAVELGAPPAAAGPRAMVVVAMTASVVAIAVAAAVFLFGGGSTGTTAGHPTVPSGAPTPSRSSAPAPSASPAAPVDTPAPDRVVVITIAGAEQSKTLDCTGNDVSVSGVRNTVVLTGQCAGLTVSGIGNVITVDSTPTIAASGINNRVTYRSGDPEVRTSGIDNVVERG